MVDSQTFRPHPVFRGGHLQTLAGFYWPTQLPSYNATVSLVSVPGGDKIALHDDCPDEWCPQDRVALLLHGLAGCHQSGYMARLADRLQRQSIRCFRMDMRGTGASAGHAKLPGHAGRTEDVAAAVDHITKLCPQSPLTLVGFSMGGNIALGSAANAAKESIGNVDRCIAVCPPVDLSMCCRELRKGTSVFYDKYLIRFLVQAWLRTGGRLPDQTPRSIYEFDDQVTAPFSGYKDAEDYYAQCSSRHRLCEITMPTKILMAKDDPVVAFAAIANAELSPAVELVATPSGGHLGYVSSKSKSGDGRWMDWQLTQWIADDAW